MRSISMTRTICPSCHSEGTREFYSVDAVPTNSCLLIDSREEALAFPTGDLRLCFCPQCGFVYNGAWKENHTVYREGYEETQAYSQTFNVFNRRLAEDLVDRHGLAGQDVLEIGCGKGEFLSLLCELGARRGIGYDPGFIPDRLNGEAAGRVQIVRNFFSDKTVGEPADFVCCKMTLEHIYEVSNFVRTTRRVVGEQRKPVVFFQVPDTDRILQDCAFWDIYYEHVSYFTAGSLSRLFTQAGFQVDRTWTDYGGQYLMIEARPSPSPRVAGPGGAPESESTAEISQLARRIDAFVSAVQASRAAWTDKFRGYAREGRKVVLWGSGSKAVAFITTLGLTAEDIAHVVDINPYRHGKYLPKTGQRIEAPGFLAVYEPDIVIMMNPIYRNEITADLISLGLSPQLMAV
jgi:hypothetical protein